MINEHLIIFLEREKERRIVKISINKIITYDYLLHI